MLTFVSLLLEILATVAANHPALLAAALPNVEH
jgi:hypothetical protein